VFLRALIAFLLMPGVVAYGIPVASLEISSRTHLLHPGGLIPLAAGSLALVWCVRDFYVSGKGTLAPWAPPTELVVVGLYRYTRNPMYVSVALVLIGWAASFGQHGLWIYTVLVAIAFHLRVVLGEEPWLARKHGAQWQDYARKVPRWFW
jgi:protein-S-isoprenylcysteine O-methyltransferase Ste14